MVQGRGNGLTSNLFAVAKSARTDSGSESHEDVGVLSSRGAPEELVGADVHAPRAPVVPVGRSGCTVHHDMANFCPRRVEITSEFIWTSG
jgi:hypothetical protein